MANLYKVTNILGTFYTVADDFGKAQENVETYLQENDFGYPGERNTAAVEIVASQDVNYNLPVLAIKKEK